MSALVGTTIPNTSFALVPYNPDLASSAACGFPISFSLHDEFRGKKVVIVSLPGAFTPVCHGSHVPGYIQHIKEFQAKGAQVYIIASNDPFVMSGWGRVQGVHDDSIKFATDVDTAFSRALGATLDMTKQHFGVRTGRYALIVDDLRITYFAQESEANDLAVSDASTVLQHL